VYSSCCVRMRDWRFPHADGHLLTDCRHSHATCLFSVHPLRNALARQLAIIRVIWYVSRILRKCMQTLLQDLRYGARMLMKNPGFTLIAVITLALGIGANTAIFSVINALILNPPHIADAERAAAIWRTAKNKRAEGFVSYLDLQDWRAANRSFEVI